jgi:fused signal recognition particle receptor
MNGDRPGLFGRLKAGLTRSAQRLSDGITGIVAKRRLDEASLNELEELLVGADLGLGLAQQLTERLKRTRFNQEVSSEEVRTALAESITAALTPVERPLVIDGAHKPFVILVIGVNGSGKTTTIGKLAKLYGDAGRAAQNLGRARPCAGDRARDRRRCRGSRFRCGDRGEEQRRRYRDHRHRGPAA